MMKVKWKRVSPWGSRLVNYRERMNIMRVYGVFKPFYGFIELSFNRRAPLIAMFSLGSVSRYEELRDGGFCKKYGDFADKS